MNEHNNHEHNEGRSKRQAIIDGIIAGLVGEGVKFLMEHAATIAAGCTTLLHYLTR